jgi:hypothetical protein
MHRDTSTIYEIAKCSMMSYVVNHVLFSALFLSVSLSAYNSASFFLSVLRSIFLRRSFSLCRTLCLYFCVVLSLCVALCPYFCVILCQYFRAMSFSKVSKDLANELILVPQPRAANKSQKQMILTVLDLSDVTRAIMEQYISIVRLGKHLSHVTM